MAILGAAVIAITLVWFFYSIRLGRRSEKKTSEKIDQLSNLLKSASTEIEKLEEELTSKSKKLQELNDTSKRLDQLVSLKEEQVEAIKQELKSTLKESSRSNKLWTIAIGAMWFILGLIVRGFLGF
jgi:uncharacterized protein YoxC